MGVFVVRSWAVGRVGDMNNAWSDTSEIPVIPPANFRRCFQSPFGEGHCPAYLSPYWRIVKIPVTGNVNQGFW